MLRGGVVHVVSACSACGVRSQALESLVRTTVTRNSHRKSANSYQMTLYQKLCEGYKRSHHSERAIELAQHHLSLAKQNNNQVAQVRVILRGVESHLFSPIADDSNAGRQIVSGRNLSNALMSKRTTMPSNGMDAWRIQDQADKAAGDARSLASSLNASVQLANTAAGAKAKEARELSQHQVRYTQPSPR
jgi:hypothetical protein